MPRVNLSVSDEVFDVLKSIPKATRGQFITASIEYFINTGDGQKIIAFLTSNNLPIVQQSSEKAETVAVTDNIGIDTSDWSVYGASIANVQVLIKPLLSAPISYSTLSHLVGGTHATRSTLSFAQRRQLTLEIIKYIKHKGVAQDYRGYFLLRTLYPEAESRVIASAIVKSIDHFFRSCTLCGSEFLTASKNVLFCDKCRKKRRAV